MLQKFNVVLSLLVCLLLAGLIVVILLGDKILGGSEEVESEGEARILTVATEKASPSSTYAVQRTYTGVLRSKQSVELGFSRSGRISEMFVDTGDRVDEGEPLAELEKDRLEQQRLQIQDSLDQPAPKPTAEGAPPPQNNGPTQSDLERVESDLEDSVLSAPFDGVISEKRLTVGSMASPGVAVFKIEQDDELEAWVPVPVDVASKLSGEEKHSLQIGETQFEAPLQSILPEVDMTTRTRTAVFTLDEKTSENHLPGESIKMQIEREIESESPGFWLPLTALTRETRGLWSVYGVDRAEGELPKVTRNFVEVIHVDGDRAWVRGTPAGEFEYIPAGISRVVPGQTVKVKGESAPESSDEENIEPEPEGQEAEQEETQ